MDINTFYFDDTDTHKNYIVKKYGNGLNNQINIMTNCRKFNTHIVKNGNIN